MTTSAEPRSRRVPRQHVADEVVGLLTGEIQTVASLGRAIGLSGRAAAGGDAVAAALAVLEANGVARYIPDSPGQRGGWVRADSAHASALVAPADFSFDYEFDKNVVLTSAFVDTDYQRPLTSLVKVITRDFDPRLFGALMLSDRGRKSPKGRRFAIIDGQTRWTAARRVGVTDAPGQIFTDMSPDEEADLFWRFQKFRKGMVSWHIFRARLRAGDETAHKIQVLAEGAGYVLGEGPDNLRSMSALEKTYLQDPFQLERALHDFRAAWPELIPEGDHIKGLHYFFRRYPIDDGVRRRKTTEKPQVNDERLVERLKVTGVGGLQRKMNAAKEVSPKGTNERFMGLAIQSAYLSGGGKP
jgi:hypothetical protein